MTVRLILSDTQERKTRFMTVLLKALSDLSTN